jgi:hypothetical protein
MGELLAQEKPGQADVIRSNMQKLKDAAKLALGHY